MTKRLFGSIFMASALALLLVAVSMLFFSSSTQAGHPTTVGAAAAQSTQVAKIKQAAGTWADIAPFPTVTIEFTPGTTPLKLKRAGASAYSLNQKLYLLGGRHGTDGEDTTLRRIFEYTPGSPGTWVQKAALLDQAPVGSRWTANMAVAELADTSGPQIYAIGGSSIDSAITMTVRIYNPIADTVSLLPQTDWWPASPARIPGGWAVVNNKLYIFGGFSALGTGSVFTETWQFDPLAPAGSKWTQKANMNLGRGFIAGAALDGQIYAIGGDTWNGSTLVPVTNVERYDPVANTWANMASLPTARGDMGAWAYDTTTNYEISGRIAVAGGVFPVPDAIGYLYNPTTNSWSSFPSMNHATRNYGYAQLNGYLYALGGYDYTLGTPSGANFNQRYDATAAQGTPTPTTTGTPLTATQTRTATRTSTGAPSTNTPTIPPTPCGGTGNYQITRGAATIVPGTTNIGSFCDDCTTSVTLPFPVQIYGTSYTTADADSNGTLQFGGSPISIFTNVCLPSTSHTAAATIFPFWEDLRTDGTGCTGGCGIFTSVSGSAPNRIFNIEWRTTYFSGGGTANFEVRLYETTPSQQFDVIYGALSQAAGATGGVQLGTGSGGRFTQDFCDTAPTSTLVTYTLPPCGSVTPGTATTTRTSTSVPTSTGTSTSTTIPTNTGTFTATRTVTSGPPTNTATLVPPTLTSTITPTIGCAPFNAQVNIESFAFQPQNLTISVGSTVQWTNLDQVAHDTYSEGNWASGLLNQGESFSFTFNSTGTYSYICTPHPFMTGTITVIGGCTPTVTNTPVPVPTSCTLQFSDVPSTNTFYPFVRCLVCRGIISGYSDGTFRPNNQVTRGQLSKMVSNSAGYNESITGQTFQDVPSTNTFYVWIERLTRRGHMSGYVCGGVGEPCINNMPYFRPFANATRAQISKIVSNAAGYTENHTNQTFQDVLTSNEFYQFIERLASRGIIGGYECGGPGEPCINNMPYFRPFNDATRGQVSKIVASAFYPNCQTP